MVDLVRQLSMLVQKAVADHIVQSVPGSTLEGITGSILLAPSSEDAAKRVEVILQDDKLGLVSHDGAFSNKILGLWEHDGSTCSKTAVEVVQECIEEVI